MESKSWSEILRAAAREDRRTQQELAKAAGLTQAQLSRFLADKRGLMFDSGGRLAAALGLMMFRRA